MAGDWWEWRTCPRCGDQAAVRLSGAEGYGYKEQLRRDVHEVDCPNGCAYTQEEAERVFGGRS